MNNILLFSQLIIIFFSLIVFFFFCWFFHWHVLIWLLIHVLSFSLLRVRVDPGRGCCYCSTDTDADISTATFLAMNSMAGCGVKYAAAGHVCSSSQASSPGDVTISDVGSKGIWSWSGALSSRNILFYGLSDVCNIPCNCIWVKRIVGRIVDSSSGVSKLRWLDRCIFWYCSRASGRVLKI